MMDFKKYRKYKAYSGFYCDPNALRSCASGGAVTAISEQIIRRGGAVFGVVYSKDYRRAEYAIARTVNELEQMKQSKYISAAKVVVEENEEKPVFECVLKELSQKPVLFIGLGCDVAALKKYCNAHHVDDSNLYLIDLICHGPTIQNVFEQYIENIEKEYNSRIVSFTTRYKKEGALPPYVKAEFKDGTSFVERFSETDLGRVFYRYAKPGCTKCVFKGLEHPGDLVIGDHLGIAREKYYNKDGVSLLVVQTQKGQQLIEMIDRSVFCLTEVDAAYAIKCNSMYWKPRVQAYDYEVFQKNMNTHGLRYAVEKIPKEEIVQKKSVKIFLRGLMPYSLVKLLKRAFNLV